MADEKKINDIKKGLAECFMVGDGCGSCPYCKECYPAKGEPKRGLLYKDTVALIDEMQAEIKSLRQKSVSQVVRCKDCVYKSNTGISNQWLPCMDTDYPDNFYCGRGERKGGDGNA